MTADGMLLGADDRVIFIRAVGHIRANDCYALREDLLPEIDSLSPDRDVFMDLSFCTYMDSTFIGLLVAMDKKIRRLHGRRLRVLNPTPACAEALGRLGLEKILSIERSEVAPPPGMRALPKTEKPGAEFILKTHEALMETSEEAKKKFGLVMELLAKKIRGE